MRQKLPQCEGSSIESVITFRVRPLCPFPNLAENDLIDKIRRPPSLSNLTRIRQPRQVVQVVQTYSLTSVTSRKILSKSLRRNIANASVVDLVQICPSLHAGRGFSLLPCRSQPDRHIVGSTPPPGTLCWCFGPLLWLGHRYVSSRLQRH